MKRTPKRTWLLIAIILVVLAGVGVAFYFGAFQSVILGEEGYQPYDALLAANSFDHAKWLFNNTGTFCDFSSCSDSTVACWSYNPYLSIKSTSVGPAIIASYPTKSLPITYDGYGYNAPSLGDGMQLRTTDLRLINFKTEFSGVVGVCSSNNGVMGGVALFSNRKAIPVVNFPSGATAGTTTTVAGITGRLRGPTAVELIWDDYQLGHYQVKANGVVVQEGVVGEGEPFYFYTMTTKLSCSLYSCIGAPVLSNPRVRKVFSCEVGAGSVKATKTFRVPGKFSINDLSGLQSFCPTIPATHMLNGSLASSSDVYYALASGQSVTVGPNEIWQVSYIANADVIGAPAVCAQWNVDAGSCSGVVDLCGGGQTYVPGVGCFAVVSSPLKVVPLPSSVSGQTLLWSSYGYDEGYGLRRDSSKLSLLSGQNVFMETSAVEIDVASCPYSYEQKEYHRDNLDKRCFRVDAFGKRFYDGDTAVVGQGLNVTLEDLQVRYEKHPATESSPIWYEYSFAAQWRLDFAPDAIRTSVKSMPYSVNLGDAQDGVFTMQNGLPGDANIVFLSQVSQNVLQDQTLKVANVSVVGAGSSQDVRVRLPSDVVGNNNVLSWAVLQTEAGSVSFRPVPSDYVVINNYNPQIQELQTRINALNLQLLTASAADAATITAQIAQLEAQQAQVIALNSTVSSLNEELLNQSERAAVLAQEITALQEQLLTANAADALVLQQKIALLNDQATQVSLLSSQLGTLQSQITSLQDQLAVAVAANASSATELQQRIVALQQQAVVLTQLNNQVSTLEERLLVAQQHNDSVLVANLTAQIDVLKAQQSRVVVQPVNWGLYAIIAGAIVVVGFIIYFMRGKKRRRG